MSHYLTVNWQSDNCLEWKGLAVNIRLEVQYIPETYNKDLQVLAEEQETYVYRKHI